MPVPFTNNPFATGNPFQRRQAIDPALNSLLRLQAAGIEPPERNKPNPLTWVMNALNFVDDKTRNPIVTGLDTLAQEADVGRALEDAWKAFKGEKKVRGAQLWDTLGVENPWVKGGLGVATDILLDPITWLGGWGTVTKPAREGISSAWKGVLQKGLEKSGVEGAKEVLKQTTKQYGTDLIEQVTKDAVSKGMGEGVAKEIAKESIRQASRRGLTRGAAQNFAEQMLSQASERTITPDMIAKMAKSMAKGSQKPLDVIGNELAKVISEPAMKLGEAIGDIGPIGEAAVGLHDWVGRSFIGRHFPTIMPGGMKEYMADFNSAKENLANILESKEFHSGLAKLRLTPETLTLDDIQAVVASDVLTNKELDSLVQYLGLSKFVKQNPFATMQQKYVNKSIELIDDAMRETQKRAADILDSNKKSLLAKLPKSDAEKVSQIIEAPIDYIIEATENSKLPKYAKELAIDAVTYEHKYEKLLDMLDDPSIPFAKRKHLHTVFDLVNKADGKIKESIVEHFGDNPDKMSFIHSVVDEYLTHMSNTATQLGLSDNTRLRYYVPRIYKNPKLLSNVDVKFVDKYPEIKNILSTYNPHEQKRYIRTLKEASEKGLEPITDLLELRVQYDKRVAQKLVRRDLIQKLESAGLVRNVSDVTSGAWVKDLTQLGIPELRNKAIHKETYNLLKQLDGVLTNNDELKTLGRNWDKLQSLWKTSVTAMRPAWYVQNITGNVLNSYLAGLKDPTRYLVAKDIMSGNMDTATQYLEKRLPQEALDSLKRANMNTAEAVEKLFKENVGTGFGQTLGGSIWGAAEDVRQIREGAKTLTQKLASVKNPRDFIAATRDISSNIETNAKLALFIDGLIKGKTPKEAADVVKAALFDYSDITQVEKGIRRLVPFYTYTRKNLAFQFQQLLEHPERFQRMMRLQENLAAGHGFDWDSLSADQKMRAVPIAQDKFLNLGIPWDTLTRVTNPRELVGMLSPMIKAPIELATNREMFTGKQIQRYPDLGTDWQAIASYLLNQFGASRELSGAVSAGMQSPAYMDRLERTTMPQLGADSESALIRALGSLAYPMVRGYDTDRATEYSKKARQRQLAQLIRALQDQGIEIPTVQEIKRPSFVKKRGRR